MGKKDKGKKKGKGAEKTALKTDKKLAAKQKKLLEKIGEVRFICVLRNNSIGPSTFCYWFHFTGGYQRNSGHIGGKRKETDYSG